MTSNQFSLTSLLSRLSPTRAAVWHPADEKTEATAQHANSLKGAKLSSLVKSSTQPVCLNLGCGNRHLDEWINIDISGDWDPKPDVLLDLTLALPLPDESVDYLLSEDFIEHISLESGKHFLRECHRIMKPEAVFRLLTPNLYTFALAYLNRSEGDLAYYTKEFGAATFAEMFNLGMRAWGHTFVYDEETLLKVITECGFEAKRLPFGVSEERMLQNVDLRDSYHTIIFELRKSPSTKTDRRA